MLLVFMETQRLGMPYSRPKVPPLVTPGRSQMRPKEDLGNRIRGEDTIAALFHLIHHDIERTSQHGYDHDPTTVSSRSAIDRDGSSGGAQHRLPGVTSSRDRSHKDLNADCKASSRAVGAGDGRGKELPTPMVPERDGVRNQQAVLARRPLEMPAERENYSTMFNNFPLGSQQETAQDELRSLCERRRLAALTRRTNVRRVQAKRSTFIHAANETIALARAEGEMKARRLLVQERDATRRLQELLHECLGEYEKTRIRAARRRKVSAEACDAALADELLRLRWERFCLRLEEDALGLVNARDLGEPARQRASNESRNALSPTRTAQLEALLEGVDLEGSRILRVVALCPCTTRTRQDAAAPKRTEEHRQGADTTAARDPGSLRRKRRSSNLEASLLAENVAARAKAVVAENSVHGLSDALRTALLCGNPALSAALSCANDVVNRRSQRRGPEGSGGSVATHKGQQTKPSMWVAALGHAVSAEKDARGGAGAGSVAERAGQGTGGRVGSSLDSHPGLLLSSSHLAWTLKPPFGGNLDRARLIRSGCDVRRGDDHSTGHREHGKAKGDCGGVEGTGRPGSCSSDAGHRESSSSQAEGAGWIAGQWALADIGGLSWRERLAHEVAWMSAEPVGSRIYFCLEEAEWEAGRLTKIRRRNDEQDQECILSAHKDFMGGSVVTDSPAGWETVDRPKNARAARAGRSAEPQQQQSPGSSWTLECPKVVSCSGMDFAATTSEMLMETFATSRDCRADPGLASGGCKDRSMDFAADNCRGGAQLWQKLVADSCEDAGAAASFLVDEVTDIHRRDRAAGHQRRRCHQQLSEMPDVLVSNFRWGCSKSPPPERHAHRTACNEESHARSHDERRCRVDDRASSVSDRDWAEAASPDALHFVPAGVFQLLGTAQCQEFLGALPAEMRRKVIARYGALPEAIPPTGRLYVPLMPSVRPAPPARHSGATATRSDMGSFASSQPLAGALLHPLPMRAMRELLQIYIASTRTHGGGSASVDAGEETCFRTSGILMPCGLGSGDVEARSTEGVSGDRGDNSLQEGEGHEGGDSNGSMAKAATTPPSAVDLLPDSQEILGRRIDNSCSCSNSGSGRLAGPSSSPANTDTSSRFLPERASAVRGQQAENGDLRCDSSAKAIPKGVQTPTEHPEAGVAGEHATIESSLVSTRYRHTYVAVLTPDSTYSVTGSSNNLRFPAEVDSDPFLVASSLFLQVERRMRALNPAQNCCDRCGHISAASTEGVESAKQASRRESTEGPVPRNCSWRACVADAVAGNARSLCRSHALLGDFLDDKAAKASRPSETKRFLQREPQLRRRSSGRKRRTAASSGLPSLSAGDEASMVAGGALGARGFAGDSEIVTARNMSPLLAELFSGKLGATIGLFCRRAVAQARAQLCGRLISDKPHRELDHSKDPRLPAKQVARFKGAVKAPAWARWRSVEEPMAAERKLDAELRWAEQVWRVEKDVTTELRRLSTLGIFPEAELALIRRGYGSLATEWREAVVDNSSSSSSSSTNRGCEGDGLEDINDGGLGRVHESETRTLPGHGGGAAALACFAGRLDGSPVKTKDRLPVGRGRSAVNDVHDARRHSAERTPAADLAPPAVDGGGRDGGNHRSERVETRQESTLEMLSETLGRSQGEIELDFSKLKRALFRRRRQEVERYKMVSAGQLLRSEPAAAPPSMTPRIGAAGPSRGIPHPGSSSAAQSHSLAKSRIRKAVRDGKSSQGSDGGDSHGSDTLSAPSAQTWSVALQAPPNGAPTEEHHLSAWWTPKMHAKGRQQTRTCERLHARQHGVPERLFSVREHQSEGGQQFRPRSHSRASQRLPYPSLEGASRTTISSRRQHVSPSPGTAAIRREATPSLRPVRKMSDTVGPLTDKSRDRLSHGSHGAHGRVVSRRRSSGRMSRLPAGAERGTRPTPYETTVLFRDR